MSDEFSQLILSELRELRREVAELRRGETRNPFENLPASAAVGKDYVAYRFRCSESAVVRGRSGTAGIRRVSNKPLKFIKRDVDGAWAEHSKTAKQKAAEEIAKAKPVRKLSIVKKAAA